VEPGCGEWGIVARHPYLAATNSVSGRVGGGDGGTAIDDVFVVIHLDPLALHSRGNRRPPKRGQRGFGHALIRRGKPS
jgi:hypothetical protein